MMKAGEMQQRIMTHAPNSGKEREFFMLGVLSILGPRDRQIIVNPGKEQEYFVKGAEQAAIFKNQADNPGEVEKLLKELTTEC